MRRIAWVAVLATAFTGVLSPVATADAKNDPPPHAAAADKVPPGQLKRIEPVPAHCDPIDVTQCLLPFPNDFFTIADASTATGRRLNLPMQAMPTNNAGVQVNPADLNRNDGFSPGAAIIVRVPNLDVARTGLAPLTDIARSLEPDAPAVLLDTLTGQRVPYWAELDTWNPDPATKALVIRPARNYLEGHRIAVALRDMRDAAGNVLNAPTNFALLRDRPVVWTDALVARKPAIDRVLADLRTAGVADRDLYLAWDFTVGSTEGIAGPMLHMRDDAYAQLGAGTPAFTVTSIEPSPNSNLLRRVIGTFDVPMYLTGTGQPGSRLVLGPDGLPQRTGTFHAEFRCLVPNSVVGAGGLVQPARGVVYGHGLLGGTGEIDGHASFANQSRIVLCATPEIGMSQGDLGNVFNILSDFSRFGSLPDRLQQGILNMQWLARLLKDPNGFGSNPAFQVAGASAIVPGEVFYNGNSQGGIFGGAATAVSKEWTRAVLGVPGMNYSTLLPRSVDFDPFLPLLSASYSDPKTYTLMVAMAQTLWDRGEANGYAQHLTTNPYPNTPAHTVLLIEAFGDHQVANIATETEARTIGAFVRQPAIAPGRSNDVTPMWDIPPVPSSPFNGSVLELWDFGTPAPPVLSIPPRPPEFGSDPHGAARNVPAVREQVSLFLSPSGAFVDVCGVSPCQG